MKFLSLKAEHFMSFKSLDYIFPDYGLYFVGGEIQDSAVSTSNRAGKSVFATEILSWGLFGKTVRGIGPDVVVNRDAGKNCHVEVIIEDDDGTYYVVHRYRKDEEHQNDLLLYKLEEDITGADVYRTQETIDGILGMNWLVFSTAVIFGEMAKRFIEAGDAEKKEVLDEILMFQCYQEAQRVVKADLNKLNDERGIMEVDIKGYRAGLDEVAIELTQNLSALKEIEEEKKGIQQQVEEKTAKVIELDKTLKTAKGAYGEAEKDLKTLEEENKKLYNYIEQVRKEENEEVEKLRKVTYVAHEKVSPILFKIEEMQEWLRNKGELPKGTRCKACGTEISEQSIEGVAKHYEEECAKLHPQYMKLQEAHQEASKQEGEAAKKWEKKLRETEQAKSELDEEMNKQQGIIRKAESDVLKLESDVTMIRQEIEHLESSYRDKEVVLLETKKRLEEKSADYEEKIKTLEEKMIKANEEVEYLKFWSSSE